MRWGPRWWCYRCGGSGNTETAKDTTQTFPTPDSFLPHTPELINILLALADGEKHGYAIMLEVETNTLGAVKMGPGTLYGSIKRMLEAGLIGESDERPDPDLDDQRRRYYALSGLGRRILHAEAQRLAAQAALAQRKGVLEGNPG